MRHAAETEGMPDLVLSDVQQRALRSLMSAQPVPGVPLPHRHLLEKIATLIPCDGIGVALADSHGHVLDAVQVPRAQPRPQVAAPDGAVDVLLQSFRNGPDLAVQLAIDRRGKPFTRRDLALLRLLEPVLDRLFGDRPVRHLPAELTVQERHVLQLVATGRSNAQIAERLSIAPSTVRKHLEHIFPKLGVSNRLAAAVAFEGRPLVESH